jgi:hypothetical protein
MAAKSRPVALRQRKEPCVGIFWVIGGDLLIDSTPLSAAEKYGDFLIHAGGHDEVWEGWRTGGKVPSESEYEEFPRGRVMYNTKTQTFTLLADRCILKQKDLVDRIKHGMHLPRDTKTGTDTHYRCSVCLHSGSD